MKVLFYKVGEEPKLVEILGTDDSMRQLVGGQLEGFELPELPNILKGKYFLVMDTDGMEKNKPTNRGQFAGDMFVLAVDEENQRYRSILEDEVSHVTFAMDILMPAAPSSN